MRRFTLPLAVLMIALLCCRHALAMGGDHGTKPVTMSDSLLPQLSSRQLTALVNRPERIGGYWVNSND
jgi:hypothetical protein